MEFCICPPDSRPAGGFPVSDCGFEIDCLIRHALCALPCASIMRGRKEIIITLLLIMLGVIVLPVLFIWDADNIFFLTIKTFLAAFFLMLLLRAVPRKKGESGHRQSGHRDEEG